jgi:DNA-binding phage protein
MLLMREDTNMHIDYWKLLLKRLLPLMKKKGSMTVLAKAIGVERQHVFKWVREGMSPNYRNGKRIEKWVDEQ